MEEISTYNQLINKYIREKATKYFMRKTEPIIKFKYINYMIIILKQKK